ncbi:TRAP transporter large permease [Rubellimicrobium aerolatum]|uniref:TRAP transporter large permease protein n=1 Tax=Rubellimicrobium aerolatum TaxID=490979 RepID=A0ABW0SCC3_9RHOB|nr:TRAP transporter large permease [Rubellimicrobium aerolatum]MBP1806339.1 tripartite ATP-independent transporter DctM subunit [Rubellimicrobium aerolatum]
MSGNLAALTGFLALILLIGIRMPIGMSMLVVGIGGYLSMSGLLPFLAYMKTTPYFLFANYTITVIPLFVLMGALAEQGGLARDLFTAARACLGHRKGGLAMAVIGACTGFGAICGSSVATTATFGRAALPELQRYGTAGSLSTGTIAAGGTLGILIPPSVVLVVYAITTEQNIAKLFQAALIPGLLAALFYCLAIAVVVRRRPHLAPVLPRVPWPERLPALVAIWPTVAVAVVVLGGIYGGVFTPTEGASVGAIAMLLIGLVTRKLGWDGLVRSLRITAETTAMIFLILLGGEVFNAFLALTQMPSSLAQWISGLGLAPTLVLALLLLSYVVLGAVMDELAMIILTLPVFFPLVQALDFGIPPDEVALWFGILVLVVVGIGLTAPPIGLNVFVIGAIARDVPLRETYRGVMPYVAADVLRLLLIFFVPAVAVGLVRWMG